MNSKLEFDSEFCNVRYIEDDKLVLLTWKKFARINDYRKPALFALDLLRKFSDSNFVIDARRGFEDDPEDVKWGFSELLPNMAKTDCKYVVFIMEKSPSIEEEMDMWANELGKYFSLIRAESYETAVREVNARLLSKHNNPPL